VIKRASLLDPLDPDTILDPFSAYRRLREEDPVYWHEDLSSWILTRYEDCRTVLSNHDLFVSDWRKVGVPTPAPLLSIQTLDPPEHTVYRRLIVRALRQRAGASLQTEIDGHVNARLEQLAGKGRVDFVSDVASPLALTIIADLLGVPTPNMSWFGEVSSRLVRSMDSGLDPAAEAPGLRARAELSALIEDWLAHPAGGGVVGELAQDRDRPGVSSSVLINSLRVVLHAGFESLGRFLANAVFHVVSNRQVAREMRSSSDVGRAVEELVRYEGSVQAESRAAVGGCEIGGKRVRKGDIVILLLGAANHDPTVFDQPEQIVLDRNPNPHLGFGHGIHACPGSGLALQTASTMLVGLLSRYPDIKLAAEPKRKVNATLRGFEHLPVSLHGFGR
jgi:cytochrome P450